MKLERNRIVTVLLVARFVLAYVVLPNLLFWLAAKVFETLPRAALNLDYLLVGAVVSFVGARVAVGVMSMAALADVFRSCGSLYYLSQRDTVSALQYVRELPAARVSTIAATTLIAVIGGSWLLVKLGGREPATRRRALWVVSLIVLLGSIGVWGGSSSLRFRDSAASSNLCTSASLSMGKAVVQALVRKSDRMSPDPIQSATRSAGWLDSTPESRNLVLVVVESLGQPIDSRWQQLVRRPFENEEIRERYEVEFGEVPFSGATVPAEFRELCGVVSGITERPTNEVKENCLPERLRAAGFTTNFLHGFSSAMFSRSEWIPELGFQRAMFHAELRGAGLSDCGGSFRGTCDQDAAAWIGEQLAANPQGSQFFYLLTVNSHLPIQFDAESSRTLACGTPKAIVEDEASCDLIALVVRAENGVARLALRSGLPQTEFVIVGDHAPPFLTRSRRELFSQTHVPFIRLIPRKNKTVN